MRWRCRRHLAGSARPHDTGSRSRRRPCEHHRSRCQAARGRLGRRHLRGTGGGQPGRPGGRRVHRGSARAARPRAGRGRRRRAGRRASTLVFPVLFRGPTAAGPAGSTSHLEASRRCDAQHPRPPAGAGSGGLGGTGRGERPLRPCRLRQRDQQLRADRSHPQRRRRQRFGRGRAHRGRGGVHAAAEPAAADNSLRLLGRRGEGPARLLPLHPRAAGGPSGSSHPDRREPRHDRAAPRGAG